jgi:hypothetical protein
MDYRQIDRRQTDPINTVRMSDRDCPSPDQLLKIMVSGQFHLGTGSNPTWKMSVSGLWQGQSSPNRLKVVNTDLNLSVFGFSRTC